MPKRSGRADYGESLVVRDGERVHRSIPAVGWQVVRAALSARLHCLGCPKHIPDVHRAQLYGDDIIVPTSQQYIDNRHLTDHFRDTDMDILEGPLVHFPSLLSHVIRPIRLFLLLFFEVSLNCPVQLLFFSSHFP